MRMHELLLCFFFLATCSVEGATIVVQPKSSISTIKAGIEMAGVGDTVLVKSGHYKEGNIAIHKRIVFMGEKFPVLDGDKQYEVISIFADSVVVSGFKVIRSGRASLNDPGGIKSYDAKYVIIENNLLDDNFFGIYIQYGKHCIIRNNVVRAYATEEQSIGNAIHCWKSDSLQIIGNRVSGHRDGIYFEFVTNSIIWRNIAERNVRYGLHFMFSNNDAYVSNVFKSNGAGVAVMYTKHVSMLNNSFINNWGDASYGLLLKDISDSYLSGNKFINNTTGIHMEGSNRIQIERNQFYSNGWGIRIQASCMDNVIRGNNFVRNTFDVATNGALVLNIFEFNYWDKYEGYDIDNDQIGDVPFRPLSLFSVIVERNPPVMLLFRSFIVSLLDRTEKIIPSLTPENFIDQNPRMKPLLL
jgi:nitrous oxidase accessory protein